ncbi:MAG: sulfotransferase [Gemmataceae bacterium]|nr:sulfotransferase [Gemmataceae bacterium]
MTSDFVTVVSGLPRSGTSLMMQMLVAGGLPALTDSQRSADESNPRGYLEYEPVKQLRTDRSWLPQARGHAVKIIHLLLRELPVVAGLDYRVVFMQRPLDEVLASQTAMLRRDGKAAGNPAILRPAFEKQLAQVEAWLATRGDMTVLPVSYHRVVSDPLAVAGEVRTFLGMSLDIDAMARAVDPSLYRERSNEGRF